METRYFGSARGWIAMAILSSLALGCASALGGRTAEGDGVRRVLLMPLNATVNLPLGLEGRLRSVTAIHVEYLEAQGFEVELVPLQQALDAWARAANRAEIDDAEIAAPTLVRALAKQHDFDMVVLPDVISGMLRVTHRPTKWDGVKRNLRVVGPSGGVHSPHVLVRGGTTRPSPTGRLSVETDTTWAMNMPALSLRLWAFEPDGKVIFKQRGGLDLVHEVYWTVAQRDRHYDTRVREDLLHDPAIVAESLKVAYEPYLPPLYFTPSPAP